MLSVHDHGNCELCNQIENDLAKERTRIAELEGDASFMREALRKIALEDPTADYAGKIARVTLMLVKEKP